MAVATLEKMSMDKITRMAYEKRQQEIDMYYLRDDRKNKKIAELTKLNAEQEKSLEEKDKALAEKDSTMLNMSKIIEEYKAKFGEISQ